MCDCKKQAKLFLSSGKLYWGWNCCGTWRMQKIKHIGLEDLKPEVLPKAPPEA